MKPTAFCFLPGRVAECSTAGDLGRLYCKHCYYEPARVGLWELRAGGRQHPHTMCTPARVGAGEGDPERTLSQISHRFQFWFSVPSLPPESSVEYPWIELRRSSKPLKPLWVLMSCDVASTFPLQLLISTLRMFPSCSCLWTTVTQGRHLKIYLYL